MVKSNLYGINGSLIARLLTNLIMMVLPITAATGVVAVEKPLREIAVFLSLYMIYDFYCEVRTVLRQ